jgi:lipopolysaccharide export system permease protein
VFGIFQRMILWELLKVFLMSLVGITGILLMAGIVAEASQHGLGPAQLFEAIPLLIPSTLPYTIPTTTLFACCVVYGRLAADNEILAIKAAGINLIKVVTPALVLGVAMSSLTMGLYYRIIPYTHYVLRAMVFKDAEEFMYATLRRVKKVENSSLPFSLYVEGVQDRKLINPVVYRKDPHGKTDLVAMAHDAELHVDVANRLVIFRMRYATFSDNGTNTGVFPDKEFSVELPENFGAEGYQRPPRDMSWKEIMDRRDELARKDADAAAKIETLKSELDHAADKEDSRKQIKNLEGERKFFQQQVVFLNVELLMRPALSIGCFCFIIVGCPIGIWFSRSDYLSSFITCFMPIVLIYYPLMLCGTNFAKEGKFEPVSLVWGSNIVIGLIGFEMFRRLLRN